MSDTKWLAVMDAVAAVVFGGQVVLQLWLHNWNAAGGWFVAILWVYISYSWMRQAKRAQDLNSDLLQTAQELLDALRSAPSTKETK